MCKAFSCIVRKDRKVFWKMGLDSHEDIRDEFNIPDDKNHIPIEITPKNRNYIKPDKWELKFDDNIPTWWKLSHERVSYSTQKEWYNQVKKIVDGKKLENILNPFDLPKVKKPNKEHIRLLREWDSMRRTMMYSVRDSVWDSALDSVGDSVRSFLMDSVWNSLIHTMRDSFCGYVKNSVKNSVWDSAWGYFGSFFNIKREKWKHTEKIKTKGYPFQTVVDLWKMGLVPSFDGKIWRLHSGKKAEVVFEITKKELRI